MHSMAHPMLALGSHAPIKMDLFGVPHLTISEHNFDIVNHIIPEGGPMGSRIGRNLGGTTLSPHIYVCVGYEKWGPFCVHLLVAKINYLG